MSDTKKNNLNTWSSFKLDGEDASTFLNGQFTSDIEKLNEKGSQFSARVSRTGHLKAYCYILRLEKESYLILCPNFLKDFLIEDLEKFIIMEDVVITENKEGLSFGFDKELSGKGIIDFFFLNKPCSLFLENSSFDYPLNELEEMSFLFGLPNDQIVLDQKTLINETALVDIGVSLDKGCFVGQETVKKIESNRGAGKKEMLFYTEGSIENHNHLKIEDVEYKILNSLKKGKGEYLKINAKREHRIDNRSFEAEVGSKKLSFSSTPFLKDLHIEYARNLFEEGVRLFTENKDQEAKSLFELSLRFVPTDEEVLESLGALEGRLGNYKKAIELMDQLEELNPSSVMASTNKSLFYMKIGEIEKAEDEKSKATVKGFEAAAKDSKKKAEEDLKETERRISMFKQVIEIDPDDHMANSGLSLSYFNLGEYDKSLGFCEKLIELDENDFKAHSIKLKIKMKNGESEYALENLPKVIELAGKKGDFVLANEMQSLLSSLKNS